MASPAHPIRVRGVLDSLAAYSPGKGRPGTVTKLSSNENPNPPLPEVIEAAARALADANRYPDMLATELTQALADIHGVDPAGVTVGNGSCSLIAHLLQVVAGEGDEVVMPWRSFEAYPILVSVAGATSVQVPLTSTFEHDPEALVDAVTDRTRAVLLCTPNNPTGTRLSRDAFTFIMENVPGDVLVLLDEAYYDFDDSPERLEGFQLVETYPNLIAARTFSKAYGLAGLRVGFAVSSPFVAEAIRKTTTPFSVNAAAQAAAIEALAHRDVIAAQVETLVAERQRVWREARALGFEVPESSANFLWFPGVWPAKTIMSACEGHNVIVRGFPDGVRVSIGATDDNDRFLTVLNDIHRKYTHY